jgi:hypothetical protein
LQGNAVQKILVGERGGKGLEERERVSGKRWDG